MPSRAATSGHSLFSSVAGGEQNSHTIGFNWHWNPNTRVMFDVVLAEPDPDSSGVDTDVTSFIIRWQFDF